MAWFRHDTDKNIVNSKEYEKLFVRIVELDSKIETLSTKFKLLETDVSNLRGNFNQRLKAIKEREELIQNETLIKDEFVSFG
jgi:predicted  nucleic acid-binding Zn-ribbon protein